MIIHPKLKKLFSKEQPKILNHPILGDLKLYQDEMDTYWELCEPWKAITLNADFDFIALPGNKEGPFNYSVTFFISHKNNLVALWERFEEALTDIVEEKFTNKSKIPLRELFFIKTLTMDSKEKWDVGFQFINKDIFIEFHMKNDEIIDFDIDYG